MKSNPHLACLTLLCGAALAPAADAPSLRGYSPESARGEHDWEVTFRAIPSTQNLHDYMQRLSARPHHVGSPYDKDNAEWILAKFKQWGLDAHIETFEVLFPTPKSRALELVAPEHFTAKLAEPTVPGDPTSGQHNEQLPTYNAYSIDGDVTAPLVYVNFGVPEDYEQLDRLGISVKGAIVISRYGGSWRGIKPKVAAEHGAIGCIIYSDPHEDGYYAGEVFPQGPYRPRDGVQRGSVMDMPIYPGDPLTPGIGATEGAKRISIKDAQTLTKIPVLPISYGDAQPLLAALTGPVAPEAWRGALPITYRVGPGPARVHLKLEFNWDMKKIYDVVARIPGSPYPDEWILRGNHHDAWVNGADDPLSGTVALMEEARAFAELGKQGWKPKRTIIYCVWDGEEEGLLGSTEFAEEHDAELRRHAAMYINSDSNSRGFLGMGGSHSLEKFINGVARDIEDPEKQMPVWNRDSLERIARAPAAEKDEVRKRSDLRIGALGSGSDYTAFIDHLGIASLNIGFGGEDGGGIYHSVYDDFYWYTHFSDGDFIYGRALAQTAGTAMMRFADADLLPYDFTNFADTVHRYVDEVQKLWKTESDEIRERNKELEEGLFSATADPRRTSLPPPPAVQPPFLNFAPLENGSAALTRAAEHYDKAVHKAKLDKPGIETVNEKLVQTERALTLPDGLPGRPWFQHQIYAPGLYTGYGVKTLPGVREAIEQKNWEQAGEQIVRVGQALEKEAALIEEAAAGLE
ncbi:MAG TPA: transferrin receptor-like dimerization domain-containing protein [Bryobacteraceae bacterium]|jgi:N-acetylated-alpha-linked acidic dipeptidase|nr:transferrin receptor-like dimerization domain-containing protein [Bryobacteraceae bacterium]